MPLSPVCCGWQTHDNVLSDSTIRSLVRRHGQIIRQAEQTEVTMLATPDDLATLELKVVPQAQPRRRAGWPAELNTAVDAALPREQIRPPNGFHMKTFSVGMAWV